MSDLRTAAQQALDSINELFAAEQSEGGERGGHIRTPATREHLVRVAQARKALHESCGALRAALAQQDEPTVTEDMKSAVRWAPSSAYWSQRLREFFGPDAREGIDALERRLAKAQQAEPASVAAAMRDARLNAGWSQQAEPLNLSDPAVQKRLATQWGYVPASAQAEPVQEPAFHGFMSDDGTQVDVCVSPSAPRRDGTYATAYYTAPPQRKLVLLTAQELDGVIERHVGGSEITDAIYTSMEQFARAVERAVWEKNHG